MIYIRDLIRKKRDGKELSRDEIIFFIDSFNRDEILQEQAAALLSMMNLKGLSENEMYHLSCAMSGTGKRIDLFELSNKIVDIHPIGGMDDKIIIMLLAILNALNLPSSKVISREIGLKDKFLGAPKYTYNEENKEKIKLALEKNEIVLMEEPKGVAPVEEKLYKLRNDIACNDDISIIATNIMSQKIALGYRNILFDISFGEKAYVKTLADAQKLAKYLIKLGTSLNKNIRCIITRLDEPVGKFFGNTLELKEAFLALKGEMTEDLKELVLEMGNILIQLETGSSNSKENKEKILYVINNRSAYNSLSQFIGIDENLLKPSKQIIPVISEEEGYIDFIDISIIRTTSKYLNAIRHTESSNLDYGTGIELSKKVGDHVNVGEIIGYIHTNDSTKTQKAVAELKNSIILSKKKNKTKSRIIEKI